MIQEITPTAPVTEMMKQNVQQEVAPATALVRDNFGWSPGMPSTGSEPDRLPRSMAGDVKLKFINGAWTADDVPCNGRELIAYDKTYSVIRWSADNMPEEVVPVARGTHTIDLAKLNAKVPQTEWRTGPNGQPEPPYQLQRVLELLDPASMERLSWPANVSVIGSSRATDELEGRIVAARRLCGSDVYPVVKLSAKHMPTRYGGRERPHFEISYWVRLSERGIERVASMQIEALPAATEAIK